MKTAVVERWLIKQALSEAILNLPVGAICLIASLVYLAVTTVVVYFIGLVAFVAFAALVKSTLDFNLEGSNWLPVIFCASFLLWLFFSHYRRNLEYLRYAKYRPAQVHVSDAGFGRALNILLSGPRAEDGFFQRLLYTGPQWFISGISMFYKSVTLTRMDIKSCAKILLIVLNKGSRVSFTDLAKLVPECNSIKVFPQLRDIAGVIFLQSEPSGISLTSDLRAELCRVLGLRVKVEPQPGYYRQTKSPPPPPRTPPPKPVVEEEPPGPHTILGVSRNASQSEIKAAYRKQIKQCHPDRFASLNQDWQQMAEQRAKVVNAAYAILTNKVGQRSARV